MPLDFLYGGHLGKLDHQVRGCFLLNRHLAEEFQAVGVQFLHCAQLARHRLQLALRGLQGYGGFAVQAHHLNESLGERVFYTLDQIGELRVKRAQLGLLLLDLGLHSRGFLLQRGGLSLRVGYHPI